MNNYDQSSSGINLELNLSYDLDRARREFEESFHILQHSGYRTNSILVFNQYGNFDVSDFEFTDLDNYNYESLTTKEIFKALYNSQYPTNIDNDLKCSDFEGIKELLVNLDVENLNSIDQRELLESIETYLYCDESFKEFLQSTFECNYITLVSRGYCQGDYSEIIIPKIVLDSFIEGCENMGTPEQVGEALQETIDHLLWDQPLYARLEIEINGGTQEFYFDEYMKDQYNYCEDELLSIFNEQYQGLEKEYINSWLVDNLPTQPDYS